MAVLTYKYLLATTVGCLLIIYCLFRALCVDFSLHTNYFPYELLPLIHVNIKKI